MINSDSDIWIISESGNVLFNRVLNKKYKMEYNQILSMEIPNMISIFEKIYGK